jgi:hypothetical protein
MRMNVQHKFKDHLCFSLLKTNQQQHNTTRRRRTSKSTMRDPSFPLNNSSSPSPSSSSFPLNNLPQQFISSPPQEQQAQGHMMINQINQCDIVRRVNLLRHFVDTATTTGETQDWFDLLQEMCKVKSMIAKRINE